MDRVLIPDDVARFILLGVPSIPYLEAMLLLRREMAQPWNPGRISQRLYLNEKAAHTLLAELQAGGVIECIDPEMRLYRYRPRTEELAQMISRLAEVHACNLIDVTNLIHSKTSKKAQQFADAFVWRKEP